MEMNKFNESFPINEKYILYGTSKLLWYFLKSVTKLNGPDTLKGSLFYDPVESISGNYKSLFKFVTSFSNLPEKEVNYFSYNELIKNSY